MFYSKCIAFASLLSDQNVCGIAASVQIVSTIFGRAADVLAVCDICVTQGGYIIRGGFSVGVAVCFLKISRIVAVYFYVRSMAISRFIVSAI